MISIYMPSSLADELPTMRGRDGKPLSPLAILLLQVTLSYSGGDYHDARPGQATLMRRTGIKTRDSLRKFFSDLEFNQVLIVDTRKEFSPGGKVICKNHYCFTFGKWIERDRENKMPGRLSDTKKTSTAISDHAKLDPLENLPQSLRAWKEHLEPMGQFQQTWYYRPKTALSREFVEGQFAKENIKIRIVSAA